MHMIIDSIKDKLHTAFCPTHLAVFDDSHKHAGHAEAKAHGGAHLRIEVVSEKFNGLKGVARHRLVYDALAEEMSTKRIHALQMTLLTPGEYMP